MTFLTLYRRSLLVILISLATTAHGSFTDFSYFSSLLKDRASGYFNSSPFLQNTYGTLSNLCQIGSMCGSGLTWFGKTGLAGTYYTTEFIKNNPKIAGTIALYTAWYMGQKRWAEDTINKAKEFLHAKIDPLTSFAKWEKAQYPTIISIMNNKIKVAQELLNDYERFSFNSFCECLKDKGNIENKQAKAIKLALEIEYIAAKQMLDLFTKNRRISLTNAPHWIEEWIQNNYEINGDVDIFDLYNILETGNPTKANFNLKNNIEEKNAAIQHISDLTTRNKQIEAEIKHTSLRRPMLIKAEQDMQHNLKLIQTYENALGERKIAIIAAITQYEQDLKQFVTQKIASTGLPVTRFSSQQPAAYWSWMQAAKWNIPSGFIWPYEQQASQLYWELFKYTQRIAALHSAISEYIKQNKLPDVGSSYSLGQSQQIIDAVNQFLGNSEACNLQYCIKKLHALQ